jgi:adenosylmethionine-8-amino-7-oxononanoate aminotransferase
MIQAVFERFGRLEGVRDARSLGICGAVNFAGDAGYLARAGWDVYHRALARGAYVRPLGNVVYITPPLNITEADLSELLGIVEDCVTEVAAERNAS